MWLSASEYEEAAELAMRRTLKQAIPDILQAIN